MKIYTKKGDGGQTSLANGQRVNKADARLEAYGTADELNAFVGLLLNGVMTDVVMSQRLIWIQNKLFNLGAGLAEADGTWLEETDVTTLEGWIDQMQTEVPPFRGFVLPSGSHNISVCHICRTITRRLERQMVRLNEDEHSSFRHDIFICFINRLSDFWFVLAQKCGKNEGVEPILWKK